MKPVKAAAMAHDARHNVGVLMRRYVCLHCHRRVKMVSTHSEDVTPHFRHDRGASCIVEESERELTGRQMRSKEESQRSEFHARWSSYFPEARRNVSYGCKQTGKRAVADVVGERRHGELPKSGVVLEFQSAYIDADVVARKTRLASSAFPGGGIVWILDVGSGWLTAQEIRIGGKKRLTKAAFEGADSRPAAALTGVLEAVSRETDEVVRDNTEVYLEDGAECPWLAKVDVRRREHAGQLLVEDFVDRRELVRRLGGSCLDVEGEADVLEIPKGGMLTDVLDYGAPMFSGTKLGAAFEAMEVLPPSIFFEATRAMIGRDLRSRLGFMMAAEVVAYLSAERSSEERRVAKAKFEDWLKRKAKFSRMGLKKLTWGKHRGSAVCELPKGYMRWAVENVWEVEREGMTEMCAYVALEARWWTAPFLKTTATSRERFEKGWAELTGLMREHGGADEEWERAVASGD